ncbi:MAG TPA: hypothetical protein VLL52_20875 [Anaerolineae bacterium]|nr:hypothetical protein [Anaerolineae bacterium]
MSAGKKWGRRFLNLLLLLVWVFFMIFPIGAFALASSGQLTLGGDTLYVRFFLTEARDVEGVGIEWTRPTTGNDILNCQRTSVTYLTWLGEGENSSYCQCFDSSENLATNHDLCLP